MTNNRAQLGSQRTPPAPSRLRRELAEELPWNTVLPTDEGDTPCAVAVEELAADAVEGLVSNGLRTVHEKLPRKAPSTRAPALLDPAPLEALGALRPPLCKTIAISSPIPCHQSFP